MAALASRGRGRGRRTLNEINMVPFIDVMLVLLIIFMVTAPLIAPSQIELPSVGAAARSPDSYVQVLIDRDGGLKVKRGGDPADATPATLEQLVTQVKALQGAAADSPVIISADRNVKYEQVVQAMDRLQRAGLPRVGLSVQTVK